MMAMSSPIAILVSQWLMLSEVCACLCVFVCVFMYVSDCVCLCMLMLIHPQEERQLLLTQRLPSVTSDVEKGA